MKSTNIKIAFDCDDTLISDGDQLIKENVDLAIKLSQMGCDIILWSQAGAERAKETLTTIQSWLSGFTSLQLEWKILEKGSIPVDISFDDEVVTHGLLNIKVPRSQK